jgi:ABC-type sugar transport system ATPase subunit
MSAALISTLGVSISGLVKRYGDTVALDGLDLDVSAGTIHGIAGPNGAGKSTLIKILASEVQPDAGAIKVCGEKWTSDSGLHQIAVVHQEAELFPNLTVGENLLVGREGTLGRPQTGPREHEVLEEMGLTRYRDMLLGDLPLGLQQRTEIGRALVRNADVFLFDEPNSALTAEESEELFVQMREFADSGRTVLFVTHRIEELASVADTVTVIVDGRCCTTITREDISPQRIARELVFGAVQHERNAPSEIVLAGDAVRVEQWTHAQQKFQDISMHVSNGEVVAVVGVEGSGGRELVQSMVGLEHTSGQSSIEDYSQVEFVAADRSESLFSNLTVAENLYLRQDRRIRNRFGMLRFAETNRLASQARADFGVKAASLSVPVRSLSGGNQQKVAIASALAVDPSLLVVEEPTRGVDVSSKAEIYHLLHEYARGGGAVLLYCTENSEAFDVADRAVVVSSGRIVGSIDVRTIPDVETLAEQITVLEAKQL